MDDEYIKLLNFAVEKGSQGFETEEFHKEFKNNHYRIQLLELAKSSGYINYASPNKHFLTFEGRLKLLEYKELEFATQSSQEAKNIALFAIMLASIIPAVLFILEQSKLSSEFKIAFGYVIIIYMIYFGFKYGVIVQKNLPQ